MTLRIVESKNFDGSSISIHRPAALKNLIETVHQEWEDFNCLFVQSSKQPYNRTRTVGLIRTKRLTTWWKSLTPVETYRHLSKMIESNFCTAERQQSIGLLGPNMKRTFEELLEVTEKNSTQVREQRRESEFGVNQSLEKGLESIQQTAKNTGTKAGVSKDSDENIHSKE